jgi:hypothetical protein
LRFAKSAVANRTDYLLGLSEMPVSSLKQW